MLRHHPRTGRRAPAFSPSSGTRPAALAQTVARTSITHNSTADASNGGIHGGQGPIGFALRNRDPRHPSTHPGRSPGLGTRKARVGGVRRLSLSRDATTPPTSRHPLPSHPTPAHALEGGSGRSPSRRLARIHSTSSRSPPTSRSTSAAGTPLRGPDHARQRHRGATRRFQGYYQAPRLRFQGGALSLSRSRSRHERRRRTRSSPPTE